MGIVSDLRHAANWVASAAERGAHPDFSEPYHALRRATEQVGTAWSGSWLPALANLYDRDLTALPAALRLLVRGGADHLPLTARMRCRPWAAAEVRAAILGRAGLADELPLRNFALAASATFDDAVISLLATLEYATAERPWDHMLEQLATAAKRIVIVDKAALIEAWRPPYSKLHRARTGGLDAAPPHIDMLASLDAMLGPFEGLFTVAGLMHRAADYLQAGGPTSPPPASAPGAGSAAAHRR